MDLNLNTLQRQIIELQIEHRDTDYLIDHMSQDPAHDELQLRRLKKRRLKLRTPSPCCSCSSNPTCLPDATARQP